MQHHLLVHGLGRDAWTTCWTSVVRDDGGRPKSTKWKGHEIRPSCSLLMMAWCRPRTSSRFASCAVAARDGPVKVVSYERPTVVVKCHLFGHHCSDKWVRTGMTMPIRGLDWVDAVPVSQTLPRVAEQTCASASRNSDLLARRGGAGNKSSRDGPPQPHESQEEGHRCLEGLVMSLVWRTSGCDFAGEGTVDGAARRRRDSSCGSRAC